MRQNFGVRLALKEPPACTCSDSSTLDLIKALKAKLRRADITDAQLAVELGMAECSIKQVFAKGRMPLSRIAQDMSSVHELSA